MSATAWTLIKITSFTPTKGVPTTTLVTIPGSGFTGATAVDFGVVGATPTVLNDGKLTVTVPCISAGNWTISVVTPNGTAVSAKQFSSAPTCT